MDALYHQTNRLIHQELSGDLARFERSIGSEESHVIENQIQAQIDHIISNCERLDVLVMKEPPTRRAHAKMRVDQLKYDCQHMQSSLRQIQHKRYVREQEDSEREALLSRTFTTNEQDTSVMIDPALQHHSKLTESHSHLDNLISHGGSIISGLRDQRGTLKGAHKRVLDIANTLGLSNTVMRLVEKRAGQDKVILVILIIISLIIMYLVWKYFS